MEKMMVIAGIWAMCALCAVLFIRGATAPERAPGGRTGDGKLDELEVMRAD